MNATQFPHRTLCKTNILDLIARTKWCHQNIGDWQIDWEHCYDPEKKLYWYCFSSQEDLVFFQLMWLYEDAK